MSEREAAAQISPEAFFDEVVPQILAVTAEQRTRLNGTCEIALFNKGQHGSWFIDLNKGEVKKGAQGKADLYMEMDRQDFADMMLNKLDVAHAIQTGRIRLSGKVPVLTHLAAVLKPRSMEY